MELRWLASPSASCFHALTAIHAQIPLADQRLAGALAAPGEALLSDLRSAGLPVTRVLDMMAGLSAGIHNNRELAGVALLKTIAADAITEPLINSLAGRIADLEMAVLQLYPRMVDDLSLRGPLREQWESRGPGLLHSLAKLTDERLLVSSADVILVHPALGGGGVAHLFNNTVRLEAVLVNPEAQLPEIVRLGWLLGQLNIDRPIFSENIHRDRLPWLAALVMIPPTLAAGEVVELTRCDVPTIELAFKTWQLERPQGTFAAEAVLNWWETYVETKPRWDVAIQALDRMFP